jgi:transposase
LPERFGKWNSVYRFHLRWSKRGVFTRILELTAAAGEPVQEDEIKVIDASHHKAHQDACRHPLPPEDTALGKTKGGRNTKLNACVNGLGKALKLTLAPGNRHEILFAVEVLGDVAGKVVLADRGYDSDDLRRHIEEAGGIPVIPPKSNRKTPVFYISEVGRRRRVVENFFCRIKRHRRVATRYDRLTETFISFVTLAAIADWVRF